MSDSMVFTLGEQGQIIYNDTHESIMRDLIDARALAHEVDREMQGVVFAELRQLRRERKTYGEPAGDTSGAESDLRKSMQAITADAPHGLEPYRLYVSLERFQVMRREARYQRIFRFFRALMSPPRHW